MIAENVSEIRQKLAAACIRVGRNPSEVTLVAVSKTFPADRIREALLGGAIDIGENYVQELLGKQKILGNNVRWHFIGHLQSNKVKYVAEWIHLIHSVDNVRLAAEIDKRAAQCGRIIDILIEVNTTGESSKYGIRPEETVQFIELLAPLKHLRIAGLMTIGPFLPDPESSRPMFRTLRELRDEGESLDQKNVTMRHLSMGMTGDFEVAVEEGATLVRIGTAIFGARKKSVPSSKETFS